MKTRSTFFWSGGGGFHFRVRGFGLTVMRRADHPPMFSERMGLRRFLSVGPYKIGVLKP